MVQRASTVTWSVAFTLKSNTDWTVMVAVPGSRASMLKKLVL